MNLKYMAGVGVDIEDINRFKEITLNENLISKLFTKNEIKYCLSKKKSEQHFCARFCAKEALIKALNKKDILFNEIEVAVDFNGKPYFEFIGKMKKTFKSSDFLLSLSHEKEKAIAFVMRR